MAEFNFKIGKSSNPGVVLQDPVKGAMVLASFTDGDNTVMLCVPADVASKLWCVSLPTSDLELTSFTASFDASGSLSVG